MKKKSLILTVSLTIILSGCSTRQITVTDPQDQQGQTYNSPDRSSAVSPSEEGTDNTDSAESTEQIESAASTEEHTAVKITSEPHSGEVTAEATSEATSEITLHTMSEFADKYHEPAYDTTDPIEAAKEYVTELEDKPYVFNFRITDARIIEAAVTHWTESLRNCVPYEGEGETVMDIYGWTTDMIDRGIFTIVRVDYYANFDHTKTPTSFEGDCYMNVYLVQYEDTGTWQVYDRGYFIYD